MMPSSLADDVLYGADQIAEFLGSKRRQVYHLSQSQRLPIFRIGTKLCARKSRLLQWIEEQEERASADQANRSQQY